MNDLFARIEKLREENSRTSGSSNSNLKETLKKICGVNTLIFENGDKFSYDINTDTEFSRIANLIKTNEFIYKQTKNEEINRIKLFYEEMLINMLKNKG
ncbi:MAG: hypothetical protein ACRCYA_00330 [Cetobacterium sp.]|uniref:hypothetical protein n=1 Tax=Cetobacterium sp. TaxID=2071632 RepID=UPI003F32E23F